MPYYESALDTPTTPQVPNQKVLELYEDARGGNDRNSRVRRGAL